LDGSGCVKIDKNELAEAVWIKRHAIPANDSYKKRKIPGEG